MQDLLHTYSQTQTLHHAYYLIGVKEVIFESLRDFLENKVGVKTHGSPDFWVGRYHNLNIDSAREIAFNQSRKDLGGTQKFFIILTDFITEEAQNSLLKVFEEPTRGTHFFVISPQEVLLPTFKSRVQVVITNSGETQNQSILKLTISDRLALVKEITEGISDEEKTKQDAINLLNQIEKELYQRGVEKNSQVLRVCEDSRLALYDRGAPVKIILENLMLAL